MKKTYRALIVDDERLARRDLISLLGEHPDVRVVGEADDFASAAAAVARLDPDLVFLDIQMPGRTGFDLLDEVETRAKVIFVTAHDEYAIRAFEVNALDYLLKPVNPEHLAGALERVRGGEQGPPEVRPLGYDDRLFLMVGSRFRFIKVSSIMVINAAEDYTEIRLSDGTGGLTLKPMREWEARLPARRFARIHRSTIINLDAVDRVEEGFNASFRVFLKGKDEPMAISRRYAARLKELLG